MSGKSLPWQQKWLTALMNSSLTVHSVTLVNDTTLLIAQVASHRGCFWFESLSVFSVWSLHVLSVHVSSNYLWWSRRYCKCKNYQASSGQHSPPDALLLLLYKQYLPNTTIFYFLFNTSFRKSGRNPGLWRFLSCPLHRGGETLLWRKAKDGGSPLHDEILEAG